MAPAWGATAPERGVVSEGPVGIAWLGRSRLFRYEIRRWRDGVIPDIDQAVDSPVDLGAAEWQARALLALVPGCPTPVWGRDGLGAGDMWNSNSVLPGCWHACGSRSAISRRRAGAGRRDGAPASGSLSGSWRDRTSGR